MLSSVSTRTSLSVSSSLKRRRSIGLSRSGVTYGSKVFQYGFSRWYFWLCIFRDGGRETRNGKREEERGHRSERKKTYTFVGVALDDGEGAWVLVVLHYEPGWWHFSKFERDACLFSCSKLHQCYLVQSVCASRHTLRHVVFFFLVRRLNDGKSRRTIPKFLCRCCRLG